MGNDYASLGKASLWCAIIGVVLPLCLLILFPASASPILCGVLLVILELVAVGCGIAARRTATGKSGLVISGILLLCVFVLFSLFYLADYTATGRAE
jgi:hypothetical protein